MIAVASVHGTLVDALLCNMTDVNWEFRLGQPVWVVEGAGHRRPAEYLGAGETEAGVRRERGVFVIFMDAPGGDVVELGSLRPRDARA
jgi:hypothetical protein